MLLILEEETNFDFGFYLPEFVMSDAKACKGCSSYSPIELYYQINISDKPKFLCHPVHSKLNILVSK